MPRARAKRREAHESVDAAVCAPCALYAAAIFRHFISPPYVTAADFAIAVTRVALLCDAMIGLHTLITTYHITPLFRLSFAAAAIMLMFRYAFAAVLLMSRFERASSCLIRC